MKVIAAIHDPTAATTIFSGLGMSTEVLDPARERYPTDDDLDALDDEVE